MNIDKVLKTLPVTRVHRIPTHPETYHLKVLFHMADRCGSRPLLVEYGVTNGSVALTMRAGACPEADVVIAGDCPEHLRPWVERGVLRHVTSLGQLERSPDLVWVGAPEAATDIDSVIALNPRVICLYDINAEAKYQMRCRAANAQAAIRLSRLEGRWRNVLSRQVEVQHTQRGLLISEAKHWSPQPLSAPALPEPEPETPAIETVAPSRPKAVYVRRPRQNDLAKDDAAP